MELEIVELAKRMREVYWRGHNHACDWSSIPECERRDWVAAAAVARPDLIPLDVPRESWLYPLFGATKKAEPGCKCRWEEGDSPCPVHPSEDDRG